jgi:hypothetical protein
MRGGVAVAPEAVSRLAPPGVGPVALAAVAMGREPVEPGGRDGLVTALAGNALGLRRGVGPMAGRAGKAHGRVVREARWMDPLCAVAAQAVPARRSQPTLHREEIVAGEAVQLLHPRRLDHVLAVAPLAALHGRLEAVDAGSMAPHAIDLLLDGVDAMPAGGTHLHPILVVGQVAGRASADLRGRVRSSRSGAGEEAADHRKALLRGRMMALLAGDAGMLAACPEREFRPRPVAGGAEAGILTDIRPQPYEAEEGGAEQGGGERREQPEAHAGRSRVQPLCRGQLP